MEVFLLFIIIVLLAVVLSNLNSKYKSTQDTVTKVLYKVEQLQKQLQNVEGKEDIKGKAEATSFQPEVPKTSLEPERTQVVLEARETIPVPVLKVESPKEPVVVSFQKPIEKKPAHIPHKSWFQTFKENNPDLEKFVGENLINKIGILILVLGISFFVKYAIDKDWINETARVGIGVLAGSLVMAVAHKLKKNFAAFSSVLVAGAISIFYFTIAIAFHEYQLFSQTVAFIIMVVITAFSTLVSVSYNRQELAVLSLIGGFAVPFMLSTGQGNYMVLFLYIAILNVGILGIAYFKKWKIVTILAFIFTSLLFSSWYVKELFDSKLPHLGALLFATLFYFIFSIIIVLNNVRNKGVFSTIEYFILVANTFLFFGLGIGIIHNWGINFKGIFSLLLAVYNLVYSIILYRKFGLEKNAIYLLIGLALTFVTLTIPIQFEGNHITLFWAAEAVLLFWLSQKSKINFFKAGAVIVQTLTLLSLVMDWNSKYNFYTEEKLTIILNPIFITGIVVFGSLLLTSFLLKKETESTTIFSFKFNPIQYKNVISWVAVVVIYFVGMLELYYHSTNFIVNTYSAMALPIAYHFVFSAVIVYFGLRLNSKKVIKTVTVLAILNVVSYLTLYYAVPSKEFFEGLLLKSNSSIAFYFHYIIFACLIYFLFILAKQIKGEAAFSVLKSKPAIWVLVFCGVYILSNELIVHSLYFTDRNEIIDDVDKSLVELNYPTNETYYSDGLYTDEIYRIKTQVVKIGYPVLWGVLSFVILIIGIRRNWKQLRIIALSLLGITIVKLFIYDINNVSETGKIIAFILLGVLILIISFVYQKIKKLVVDESPKIESDEN